MEPEITPAPDETLFGTIRKTIPPMHPEGWKFTALFMLATLLLSRVIRGPRRHAELAR